MLSYYVAFQTALHMLPLVSAALFTPCRPCRLLKGRVASVIWKDKLAWLVLEENIQPLIK